MSHWWENYPWRMIQTNLREPDTADLDPAAFVRDLQSVHATAVTLNAAGIIASYNTLVEDHTKSAYLEGYQLRDVIDACHRAGIKVIARTDFSKVRRPVIDRHPDWAYRNANGDLYNCNGNVQVCPNGPYPMEKVYEILKELITTFPFDGIFFNMSSFFVTGYDGSLQGPCMCPRCKQLYKEQTGLDAPAGGMRDPGFLRYIGFQQKMSAAHKAEQHRFLKALNPELAVHGFEYNRVESGTELGQRPWVYTASVHARSGSRTQVIDNVSVDFMGFRYRDASVSPALVELRLWQTLANGGGLSHYIMGRLDNHRDISSFAPVRKVFGFHKDHEAVYTGLSSAAETLVIQKGAPGRDDPEVYGWIQALTQSHIPFDECKLQQLRPEVLNSKRLVILGDLRSLTKEQVAVLDTFADQGGTVLATGETGIARGKEGSTMLLHCLGVSSLGEPQKNLMASCLEVPEDQLSQFPRCRKAPILPFGSEFRMAEFAAGAETYLRLIPEHPFGPPERCYHVPATDHPGITVYRYGAGKGIWLPAQIGSFYYREGWENTLNLMQDMLFSLCGMPELAPGLSPMVELTLAKKEGQTLVQLVNGSGHFGNNWFQPLPIRDIFLRLPNLAGQPVHTLNGGQVTQTDGGEDLVLHLDELRDYEAICIGPAGV